MAGGAGGHGDLGRVAHLRRSSGSRAYPAGGKAVRHRLASLAAKQGLRVEWIKPQKSLLVTGRGSRILLHLNSRECDVNGLRVWLLYPVEQRAGLVYVCQIDLDHTFAPILTPPRNPTGEKVRTICLDAGHGGGDPGNHTGPRQEKTYTLLLATELRSQLLAAGFLVTMVRSTDATVDLDRRAGIAARGRPDLFVSLHFNAAASARSEAKGAEVYCLTPAGAPSTNARGEGALTRSFSGNRFNSRNLALARQVQKALIARLGVEDRGVRRARFEVLRDAAMPAVLIEAGFLSHPVEGKKITEASYRREMARAIVEGLKGYKELVER